MKKIIVLLMGIVFVSSTMIAQTGTIQGIVKDSETGEPVFLANVYIKVGGNQLGAVTDIDGRYTLKPVNVGSHTIYFSFVGYNTKKISDVQITSGQIVFVNTDMNASIDIETFVVEEEKYDIPLINHGEPYVQRILPDQIKNDPNRLDPIKMIGVVGGVTVNENKEVSIRGSRPSSTQFITDGIKSRSGSIGIPGQAIGSIKVYTGGIPAQYGDVTGGLIVVETKSYFDLAQQYKK